MNRPVKALSKTAARKIEQAAASDPTVSHTPKRALKAAAATVQKTTAKATSTAKVRPTITAYPQISQHLGEAIAAVLLGKRSPADALKQAVDQCNQVLAVPN